MLDKQPSTILKNSTLDMPTVDEDTDEKENDEAVQKPAKKTVKF